jgi:membrane protein
MSGMAKISDVPTVMRSMGVKGFLKNVWAEISADGVFTWASALAYSWVFALFPLLIAMLTLAPYLPGDTKENARRQINDTIAQSMGAQAKETIGKSISDVMDQTQGGLFSIGLLLALWSASGGMTMTMTALDKAYGVKNERPFLKHRGIAVGLTLATIALVLSVMVLLPIGGAIVDYIKKWAIVGPVAVVALNILRYVVAVTLLFTIVALVYYFGPNIKQKWQTVTPGAILAVVMWILMGIGFSIYVQNFANFNKTYGALGAAIILLLFFYLSMTVLLIGAEVNSVIDFAVLGVEPGTRDFTCEPKGAIRPSGGAKEGEGTSGADRPQPKRPEADAASIPVRAAPAGWWKWAAASVVGAWAARKMVGGPPDTPRVPT